MDKINTAIATFLSHCQFEKNLSIKTLKAYNIDLTQLVQFVLKHGYPLTINEINKTILREYIQSIGFHKPKTVKRKIASIKAFFNFLEFEDRITISPFRKMKVQIREPKNLPTVMDLHEIEKILKSVYQKKSLEPKNDTYSYHEKVRDIAVIELLFATGIRVSELTGLTEEHINLSTGQIKVRGKGNKERIIQVCNQEALQSLKEYYLLFQNKIRNSDGYFFINRIHQKLSEQSVRYLVKRHAKCAGIDRRITPHVFRHSFATLLLEENVDIRYIQHMLGHSSIMVTQIYTHVNGEKQREILSQRHPRRNLEMIIN
jgi:integrase/recombinase XerD